MLCLNENASELWHDNIYMWIISVSLGMNEISPRQRFAFHFTVFPWCCSFFPEKGHTGANPLVPWVLPALQAGSLSPSPASCSKGTWAGIEEQEIWVPMSPHAHLLCCGFLRASTELHSPLLVGFFVFGGVLLSLVFFFNLSTRPGTETINSFHWKSYSQLQSSTAASASTRVFYPLLQLSQLLWKSRFMCCDVRECFLLRKQCEELP